MNCPKCQQQMKAISYANVEVDRCEGCGGICFDALENPDINAAARG